ncbi:MAG: hypothetical protein NC218_07230 [Acetobacter sp.]|nr:hypothetical protein [Acetobacter sp.]
MRLWEIFWHKGGIRVRKRGTYGRFIDSMIAAKYYGGRLPQVEDSDDMITC